MEIKAEVKFGIGDTCFIYVLGAYVDAVVEEICLTLNKGSTHVSYRFSKGGFDAKEEDVLTYEEAIMTGEEVVIRNK